MVALVFELYGALCFFSLIAFLVLASVAKLRPDLDEEEFDIGELEKVKKLANSEHFVNALPVEDPIVELSRSVPSRTVKQSKRLIHRLPHLIHLRKPRIT